MKTLEEIKAKQDALNLELIEITEDLKTEKIGVFIVIAKMQLKSIEDRLLLIKWILSE